MLPSDYIKCEFNGTGSIWTTDTEDIEIGNCDRSTFVFEMIELLNSRIPFIIEFCNVGFINVAMEFFDEITIKKCVHHLEISW